MNIGMSRLRRNELKGRLRQTKREIISEDKFFVHSFFVSIVLLVSRAYASVCYLSREIKHAKTPKR